MYDDIITKPKKEETYTCISCDHIIKVGQDCPTCGSKGEVKSNKATAEAYKKFLEAANKTSSPMED